jgi:hypothetical protein
LSASWAGFGLSKNPPNAALTVLHGKRHQDTVVVELGTPRYYPKSRSIQYRARLLSSADRGLAHFEERRDRRVPRTLRDVSLFIDDAMGQVINGCLVRAGVSCPVGDRTGVEQISFYGSAFARGTLVLMSDGRLKAIELVSVGDQVMSIDADGAQTPAPVTLAAGTGATEAAMVYAVIGGRQLISTPATIFPGGVRADELRVGDSLRNVYGTDERVDQLAVGRFSGGVSALGVGGPTGMFFVGGLLVHGYGRA